MHYLLYGENEYSINQKIKELSFPDVDINYFDGSTKDFKLIKVIDDCNTIGLFSDRKVIVVENYLGFKRGKKVSKADGEELLSYLQHENDDVILIFKCLYKVDGIKSITKAFKKNKFELNNLDDSKFEMFVRKSLNSRNIEIEPLAFKDLCLRLNYNQFTLMTVCNKLENYHGIITEDVVRILVDANLNDNVNLLIYAILSKEKVKAIKLLNDLFLLETSFIYILIIFATNYRRLYDVSFLLSQNKSQKEIAESLRMSPGATYNSIKNCRSHSLSYFSKCLFDLALLDQKYKTNSKIDEKLELEVFILKRI